MDTIYKIINDESFLYLSRYNQSLHIFDIIPQNERTHSSLIAWLIDPNEGHGMGDYFIKNMFYSLVFDENFPLSINEIESISFGNLIIDTEVAVSNTNIIDILMYDPINRYLFVIENKYGATLTNNQLERYNDWAEKQKENIPNLTKVLIVIDGLSTISSVAQSWSVINYEWITSSIVSLLGRGILNAEIEKLLRDYYISIEGEYGLDPQLKDYKKHLANLAERYPEFIDWLQNERSYLLDSKYSELIQEISLSDSEVSLLIHKNKPIFLELIEYSRYDWLQQQLQNAFPSLFEFEKSSNKCNAFPLSWKPLMADPDGYWPIYIQLEENKDSDKIYTLSMCLRKNYIQPEKEYLLESIASDKGENFRKNQRSKNNNNT